MSNNFNGCVVVVVGFFIVMVSILVAMVCIILCTNYYFKNKNIIQELNECYNNNIQDVVSVECSSSTIKKIIK